MKDLRLRSLPAGLILLTALVTADRADAAPAAMSPPAAVEAVSGEILALDVHQATRFVSLVFRCSVLVAGGEPEPLRVHLGGSSNEVAKVFDLLASGSHLVVAQKDSVWVLVPPALADWIEGPRRSLPPGARLNLDYTLVAADEVVRVLAQALRLQPDGHVGGRVTVRGEKLPSLRLVGLLTRLAGREASRHDRRLVVGERLPDAPPTPSSSPCARPADGGAEASGALSCIDPASLEVVAWAIRGDARWAVVRARSTATGQPPVLATVARGESLGAGGARVQTIDATGITLSNEMKIPAIAVGR